MQYHINFYYHNYLLYRDHIIKKHADSKKKKKKRIQKTRYSELKGISTYSQHQHRRQYHHQEILKILQFLKSSISIFSTIQFLNGAERKFLYIKLRLKYSFYFITFYLHRSIYISHTKGQLL